MQQELQDPLKENGRGREDDADFAVIPFVALFQCLHIHNY